MVLNYFPLVDSRIRQNTPVEDIIVLIAFSSKEVAENLAQVRIIGLVIEAESASVVLKKF